LVDDGELAVEVMAEQPQQALAFVEFNAQPLGFLAGRRLHDLMSEYDRSLRQIQCGDPDSPSSLTCTQPDG
jgi:hypothetical protein